MFNPFQSFGIRRFRISCNPPVRTPKRKRVETFRGAFKRPLARLITYPGVTIVK